MTEDRFVWPSLREKSVESAFQTAYGATVEYLEGLDLQSKLILRSLSLEEGQSRIMDTYRYYSILARDSGAHVLTYRAVNNIFRKLASHGILQVDVRSLGRYGRSGTVRLLVPRPIVEACCGWVSVPAKQ